MGSSHPWWWIDAGNLWGNQHRLRLRAHRKCRRMSIWAIGGSRNFWTWVSWCSKWWLLCLHCSFSQYPDSYLRHIQQLVRFSCSKTWHFDNLAKRLLMGLWQVDHWSLQKPPITFSIAAHSGWSHFESIGNKGSYRSDQYFAALLEVVLTWLPSNHWWKVSCCQDPLQVFLDSNPFWAEGPSFWELVFVALQQFVTFRQPLLVGDFWSKELFGSSFRESQVVIVANHFW